MENTWIKIARGARNAGTQTNGHAAKAVKGMPGQLICSGPGIELNVVTIVLDRIRMPSTFQAMTTPGFRFNLAMANATNGAVSPTITSKLRPSNVTCSGAPPDA